MSGPNYAAVKCGACIYNKDVSFSKPFTNHRKIFRKKC